MGAFRCIVEGTEEGCRAFFKADTHCYYRDIDAEYDTGNGYIIWFCGDRKYLPDVIDIKKWSRQFAVEVKGSFAYEDREEGDPTGSYFHYINGKIAEDDFNEEELAYLDVDAYGWD